MANADVQNLVITLHGRGWSQRRVAGELGIARQRVMAIGDHANDAEMLRWAGMGVAMGNAIPEVLAAANYVTEGHHEDGVANAIHKLVFHGRPLSAILTEDA
mgnify:CR=1 FL=1